MKPATLFAFVLLALVAVSHVMRVVLGVEILVGGNVLIPQTVSVLGAALFGAAAVLLWKQHYRE